MNMVIVLCVWIGNMLNIITPQNNLHGNVAGSALCIAFCVCIPCLQIWTSCFAGAKMLLLFISHNGTFLLKWKSSSQSTHIFTFKLVLSAQNEWLLSWKLNSFYLNENSYRVERLFVRNRTCYLSWNVVLLKFKQYFDWKLFCSKLLVWKSKIVLLNIENMAPTAQASINPSLTMDSCIFI